MMREWFELSYAAPSDPVSRKIAIHAIEFMSGKVPAMRGIKRYRRDDKPLGAPLFSTLLKYLDVSSVANNGSVSTPIPSDDSEGLVVVSNHPYGLLDGMILCQFAEKAGRQFRILANHELSKFPEIEDYLLPVDFAHTPDALKRNLKTRNDARTFLNNGGVLIVFPAGGISTSPELFSAAVDSEWKLFTASLIEKSKANVLPVYIKGQNSVLFQLASRLSASLRLALVLRETIRRRHELIHCRCGEIIKFEELKSKGDRKAMIKYLREVTFGLGGFSSEKALETYDPPIFRDGKADMWVKRAAMR